MYKKRNVSKSGRKNLILDDDKSPQPKRTYEIPKFKSNGSSYGQEDSFSS